MSEHPIESLMQNAMNNIKDMIDVNTIIGDTIKISEKITIIPVSKVCFGFAAGGTEFKNDNLKDNKLPFGGGSGAAVSIHPVAFMVINDNTIKLLPAYSESSIDKIINYVPDMIEKANNLIKKDTNNDEDV